MRASDVPQMATTHATFRKGDVCNEAHHFGASGSANCGGDGMASAIWVYSTRPTNPRREKKSCGSAVRTCALPNGLPGAIRAALEVFIRNNRVIGRKK